MITLGIAYPDRTKEESRSVVITNDIKKLMYTAFSLATDIDSAPQGGEFKRGQVYSKMMKLYPQVAKDDIAFAIELAVRKMKGKLWP